MAKISVIVPVYKAEAYLARCIDSILTQNVSDLEVILVDDGSPDNCYAICQEYAAKDSRVLVLRQENQGQAAARNHAMSVAKGQWICFVDSDDLIHPQMLELLYQAATESGAGISMCQMLEGAEVPESFQQPHKAQFEILNMDENTLVNLYDNEEYPAWVACAKLIRRELVEAYPFREGRVFEDNEAVCHWVCQGKLLAKMEHKLYFYRKNIGSTTKSDFSLKKLDYLWALESITRYYDSLNFMLMKQRFLDRYIDAAINACYGARDVLNRVEVAKKIEKQARKFVKEQHRKLTKEQFEALLDGAHPVLIRFYWPLEGVTRTLRESGLRGLAEKLIRRKQKGADE